MNLSTLTRSALTRSALTRSVLGLGLAFGLAVVPAAAQDLTADEMIDGLEDAVKKGNDPQAIGIFELMQEAYAKYEESDQKKIVKAVNKCLGRRRDEGETELYIGALKALETMGEPGLKSAIKALKNKNVKDRPSVMAAAVHSVASHKDDKAVDEVVGFLVYKEPIVVAEAASSLGEFYADKPAKDRKELAGEVVKNYANYHSLAVSNPLKPVFAERLAVVERPMLRALSQLTGVEQADAPAWQKWYNDNKKKKWPERETDGG